MRQSYQYTWKEDDGQTRSRAYPYGAKGRAGAELERLFDYEEAHLAIEMRLENLEDENLPEHHAEIEALRKVLRVLGSNVPEIR